MYLFFRKTPKVQKEPYIAPCVQCLVLHLRIYGLWDHIAGSPRAG